MAFFRTILRTISGGGAGQRSGRPASAVREGRRRTAALWAEARKALHDGQEGEAVDLARQAAEIEGRGEEPDSPFGFSASAAATELDALAKVERLLTLLYEERGKMRRARTSLDQLVVYGPLLCDAQRNHPKRPARSVFLEVFEHQLNDPACLLAIRSGSAAFVHGVGNVFELDAVVDGDWAGEGHQLAVIELPVGEGYQAFVPAAVVPAKAATTERRHCRTLIEDAFERRLVDDTLV